MTTTALYRPNATSPESRSALPERWVAKIFRRLEGRYGSLFLDRWRGCDMANVMDTWAEELAGFHDKPECIDYALRSLADSQFPPTLPEFLAACRRAPGKDVAALPHKLTPEEIQHQHEMADKVAKAAKTKGDGYDPLMWAKRPRSQHALNMVIDAAKKPRQYPALAKIFDSLVADGICTEKGQLLKRYEGMGSWVAM